MQFLMLLLFVTVESIIARMALKSQRAEGALFGGIIVILLYSGNQVNDIGGLLCAVIGIELFERYETRKKQTVGMTVNSLAK